MSITICRGMAWCEIRFRCFCCRLSRTTQNQMVKVRASRRSNSRSGRDASRSEADWPCRFRASNREDEWHQRSTATILRESVCDPGSCSSSPSAAAAALDVVAAARARTVPCSSAWAHNQGQRKKSAFDRENVRLPQYSSLSCSGKGLVSERHRTRLNRPEQLPLLTVLDVANRTWNDK